MRKLDVTTALFITIIAGLAWVPANAQNSYLADRCTVPAPEDEKAFADLQDCLKALDARVVSLDASVAQSAGTPRESLKDERRLTGYALAAVKSYTDAVAALRANLKSQEDLSARIEDLAKYTSAAPAGQRATLAAIKLHEEARLTELESKEEGFRKTAEKARPPAENYVAAISLSREDVLIEEPRSRKRSAACAQMVEEPDLSLDISDCAADAIGSFAGGSVRVPGSFLNPRGFSALLSGSDSAGTIGITFAKEVKRRLPITTETAAQALIRPGFSLGVSSGGGEIFKQDDEKDFLDRFDSKVTVSGGLFLHFYGTQRRQSWEAEAEKLSADAKSACLADQAKAEPSVRSNCSRQSLTDWVYAPEKGKSGLMHPEIAKRTNALYYGSEDLIPRWGFGIEGSISRPSAEYLREDAFATFFTGSFDEDFEDAALEKDRKVAWSVEPYFFKRFGSDQARTQTVAAASFSIARKFGFSDSAEKTTFCPAIDTTTPFSLGDCKSYFTSAPPDRMVYTPSGELRFLFSGDGWLPPTAVSPKLSYTFGKETPSGDPARWTLSIPALVFVDDKLSTGLGLKVDHSWGGTRLDAATATLVDKDSKTKVSLVFSKTFSLTGMR